MREKFGELLVIGVLALKMKMAGNRGAVKAVDTPIVELATPTTLVSTPAMRALLTKEYPDQFQRIAFKKRTQSGIIDERRAVAGGFCGRILELDDALRVAKGKRPTFRKPEVKAADQSWSRDGEVKRLLDRIIMS